MAIDLKPEQQRMIDLAMESGAYQDPGEVLDQALEIIREQLELGDWMLEQRASVTAQIEEGFAQAERGKLIDGDAAIAMLQKRRRNVAIFLAPRWEPMDTDKREPCREAPGRHTEAEWEDV